MAALLSVTGRCGPIDGFDSLKAGGNNRVYRVRCGAEEFVAKCYYSSPADPRDRLRSEFVFSTHAWNHGLRCLPQPIAADEESRIALYEYVAGTRIEPAMVDREIVLAAATFFARLNSSTSRDAAAHLPPASEACFSVRQHVRMLDSRLDRLFAIEPASTVDREATAFVAELHDVWSRVRGHIESQSADPVAELPDSWRCLSPSDFGFHNSVQRVSGEVCFLDFEYAGWDDPAKMIGDFFAHPGCPVGSAHRAEFVTEALAPFRESDRISERAELLEPIFRIKWCCIILNEFLGDAARRRAFADPSADPESRKARQLVKARELFQTIRQRGN